MSKAVSALDGAAVDDALIGIEDTGLRGQITLRGDLSSAELSTAVNGIADVSVPAPLQISGGAAVWMSPDELLLLVPAEEAEARTQALGEALEGTHHMALDVSDTRAILRLTGARVGEILAKGAPCDCSDHGFPPGTARRTHMGGLAVAIWRLDATTWEIACFRSFVHHLMAWLEQTAQPGSEVY